MRFPAPLLFLLLAGALSAQTSETSIFRAVLLPANLVPAVNSANRGVADVIASVVRDSSGQIVSGTVDVLTRATFAAGATAVAMDVRSGSAGQNGALAFSSELSGSNSRPLSNGGDAIRVPSQVAPENAAGVASLRSLFQDPSRFYILLATSDSPNGAMRGQLQRAQVAVLMGLLSSGSVLPPPTGTAEGLAQVIAIGTRDAAGNWTSGEVYLSASCVSSDITAFTGFHIHAGAPGGIGPAVLSPAIPAGILADPWGAASLGPVNSELTVTNAAQATAFGNLFGNPGALYVDLHTAANPNGILRAQLRPTESTAFSLLLSSSNEVRQPGAQALAPATFTVYTLRNEDGSPAAATILADVNYRFPQRTQFLGIFFHDGGEGEEGRISIPVAPNFSSDTGFGNYFNWSAPIRGGALEDILKNPENHYVSLHTVSDPMGAARSQFAAPVRARPIVAAVIGANLDKNAITAAPGGLISIFGTNLVKIPADLRGWAGAVLPGFLNGTAVSVAGRLAPLIYVSPGQINAQVPSETPPGVAVVYVENSNGGSAAFPVNIAPVAPAIFFSPVPAVIKNANFSLVTAANPARAGDVLIIYATGFGQTTPAMPAGVLVPSGILPRTADVTATIGGRPASVAYSIASPLSVGLYQVAVTVPAGVSGSVPVVLQIGGINSNSVNIAVQ